MSDGNLSTPMYEFCYTFEVGCSTETQLLHDSNSELDWNLYHMANCIYTPPAQTEQVPNISLRPIKKHFHRKMGFLCQNFFFRYQTKYYRSPIRFYKTQTKFDKTPTKWPKNPTRLTEHILKISENIPFQNEINLNYSCNKNKF